MAGRPTPPASRPPGGRGGDGSTDAASGLRTPLVAAGGDAGAHDGVTGSFDAEAAAAASTATAWPGLGGGDGDDDGEDDLLLGPGGSGPGAALRRALAGRPSGPHRRLNAVVAREPAAVNHRYSPAERARLAAVEGIEYLPPDSAVYRRWLAGQPHGRQWDRWVMMAAIGVSVGLLGAALKAAIGALAGTRIRAVAAVAARAGAVPALVVGVAWSAALAAVAAWPVYAIAPQAAGAGVAEVMAYLNGCVVPKIFSLPTLAVKFASCAAAVSAGLPVGPEGPMVHMGALIGGGLSQGVSTTLGVSAPALLAPTRFRNPKDKRDFVAAGTAVGIATAFGAPIGGLLFAFEELAVPFSPALAAQILAAAAAAVLALNSARSFAASTFGALDGDASPVFFEVRTQLANHVAAMVPAAGLGAVCGAAAAAFTAAVLAWTRARDAWLSGPAAPRRARLLEPVAIAAVFTGVSLLLAGLWPCTAAACVLPPAAAVGEPPPACPPPSTSLAPSTRAVVADAAVAAWTCGRRHGGPPPIPPPGDPAWKNASTSTDGGGPAALPGPLAFNELASLAAGTGEDTIRRLLSRGTHREFGYGALLAWLALYAAGAVASAAAGVASGLFVPMLAMGAAIGRLAGLAAVDVAASFGAGSAGAPPGVFMPPSPWAWLDPGAFALIGAGAFLGGVTRLTVAAAVIMMEVSNDARSLLPLLVSILAAKAVADAVVHPLYHGLLAAKCVPWLPGDPVCGVPLDLVPASAAAAAPVAVADVALPASALRALLRDTAHHGFPVVKAGAGGSVYLGLVSRETCLALLRRAAALGGRGGGGGGAGSAAAIPYEDLNRRYVSAAARSLLSEQQLAVLSGGGGGHGGGSAGGSSATLNGGAGEPPSATPGPTGDDPVIDLSPYVNTSAPAVPDSFSLGRAYALFVRLGLRHLPVVDGRNRVVGMLTRKDLLGCRLDDAAAKALGNGHVSAAAVSPSSPAWAGWRAGGGGVEGGAGVAYGF